jgi:hypothetical protein
MQLPILIILIIYLIILEYHFWYISHVLSGFWYADEEFCEQCEIDTFMIYLGSPSWFSRSRGAYVLMVKGESVLVNHPCTVSLQCNWRVSNWSIGMNPKYFSLKFSETPPQLPKTVILKMYPQENKMVLRDSDTIYGIFYKDGSQSELVSMLDEK